MTKRWQFSPAARGKPGLDLHVKRRSARKFRYEAPAGKIGVSIGVAAPMAYFPFSGWKASFLGVLHGQRGDGVEFYTEKKVVVERWPKEWSRKILIPKGQPDVWRFEKLIIFRNAP